MRDTANHVAVDDGPETINVHVLQQLLHVSQWACCYRDGRIRFLHMDKKDPTINAGDNGSVISMMSRWQSVHRPIHRSPHT